MSLDDFRQESRAWLLANAPESLLGTRKGDFEGFWGGRKAPEPPADVARWRDVMIEKGWTAPSWPTEYGGGGLSKDEHLVLDEIMRDLELPLPVVGFGMAMIGPTLLHFGTPEQKAQHIPAIIKGEVRWCQGYSEPGSGSDLASLQCRAQSDGDHYVINGQKIWTSYADKSDWLFCLVRTNTEVKKQAGITFILIDMDTPGVTPRPIQLISGRSPFCEVFLEDVRVPKSNVILEENQGWTVAKALLGFERSMIGRSTGGQLMTTEAELVELAREYVGPAAEGPLSESELRHRIAHYAMDQECFGLTIDRIAQNAQQDGRPGPESSILKVVGSELKQRRWFLSTQILGEQALGWDGAGFSADELDVTRQWLRSRGNTIEGGTSEIQLNILAKRVLGLPTS